MVVWMCECSSFAVAEAVLKKLCWIPFGLKTISIEAKGGIYCLDPPRDEVKGLKESTIFVEVPPGAVRAPAKVKMRYAIIPSGSFTLPKGYKLGSPVVYINYVTKPLSLHIPHWYGGRDHTKDGLSFAIAPCSPKGATAAYKFQLIEGGTFSHHLQYGALHIDGHSSLFAVVFKERATSVYLATQWEQHLTCETNTKIVITYFSNMWLEVCD